MSGRQPKIAGEVTLDEPIIAHGESVSKLTVHEPTFGDLMTLDSVEGDLAKAGKLIECVCKINADAVKQLSAGEIAEVVKTLAPFLSGFDDFLKT